MGRRVPHEDGHHDGRPRVAPHGRPDPLERALIERGHAFADKPKPPKDGVPKPPPPPPPQPEPPRPAARTEND